MSSIPGSVGYVSHVHTVYDYLGPLGFSGYIWLDTKIVLKNGTSVAVFFKLDRIDMPSYVSPRQTTPQLGK